VLTSDFCRLGLGEHTSSSLSFWPVPSCGSISIFRRPRARRSKRWIVCLTATLVRGMRSFSEKLSRRSACLLSQALRWCGWRRERRVMLSRWLSCLGRYNGTRCGLELDKNSRLMPIFNTSEPRMQYSNPRADHSLTCCYYTGITIPPGPSLCAHDDRDSSIIILESLTSIVSITFLLITDRLTRSMSGSTYSWHIIHLASVTGLRVAVSYSSGVFGIVLSIFV
jgi:hypothetical protein